MFALKPLIDRKLSVENVRFGRHGERIQSRTVDTTEMATDCVTIAHAPPPSTATTTASTAAISVEKMTRISSTRNFNSRARREPWIEPTASKRNAIPSTANIGLIRGSP
jgi:hypothetical protein